ncbi:MAG: hypothetical protein KO206_04890 [Methanomicrobiaceae archaeon]|nr:hypothetical protein [Methanomicrobiaceae archaeon]
MDEVIEEGYSRLIEKLEETSRRREELSREVRDREAALLGRMAEKTMPVIGQKGLEMLELGKVDPGGAIYDPVYYPKKMILLGKTDPVPYRPDDPTKPVENQICVLSEDGKFFELMYSSDGFILDSYLNPLTPAEALDLYGYEIMLMLYRAMREYLESEGDLVDALAKTLEFIVG